MNDLAPFLYGASQGGGQFAVVGGLSCVYQAAHDDVIGFIEGLSVAMAHLSMMTNVATGNR